MKIKKDFLTIFPKTIRSLVKYFYSKKMLPLRVPKLSSQLKRTKSIDSNEIKLRNKLKNKVPVKKIHISPQLPCLQFSALFSTTKQCINSKKKTGMAASFNQTLVSFIIATVLSCNLCLSLRITPLDVLTAIQKSPFNFFAQYIQILLKICLYNNTQIIRSNVQLHGNKSI